MEVSDKLHYPAALSPKKDLFLFTNWEGGLALEMV